MAKNTRRTRKQVSKTAPPVTSAPVSKQWAGHMLHARCETYAHPNAERHGYFEADPKQIGAVSYKPFAPGPEAGTGLVHLLKSACQNAVNMGATEIRIKIRRQWYSDTREAE